ncbi:DUF3850 domain-containing protein [Candidatus Enterococcus leclercqii]|uniref:DUF3850 domain-containing protein n=1 Tax=Candidatus Enterococcus leclercqii TaxID=1857218 RepID=UPI00137A88E7|nr:DUF3850 domain-containing protein [Enterococcus sp. CU9D]KAF1291069.1 RNA-binding protein [Enterococcus sp. CU9D]
MEHKLKIRQEFFEPVIQGKKRFEIRKNDRNFKVGDIIMLEEIDENSVYTGDSFKTRITFITDYQQKGGYVVLGISSEIV